MQKAKKFYEMNYFYDCPKRVCSTAIQLLQSEGHVFKLRRIVENI